MRFRASYRKEACGLGDIRLPDVGVPGLQSSLKGTDEWSEDDVRMNERSAHAKMSCKSKVGPLREGTSTVLKQSGVAGS